MRNVFPNDEQVSRLMAEGVRGAFEEDREILNAVQQNVAASHTPNIDIAIDSAPLRFRRRLRQLIEAQINGGGGVSDAGDLSQIEG